MHTKDRLSAALTEIGLGLMAQTAATGYYDDFQSPLDLPIAQLVKDLEKQGRTGRISMATARAFIQRVKDGEFDGTSEEAEAWAASPEGRQTIEKLAKGVCTNA